MSDNATIAVVICAVAAMFVGIVWAPQFSGAPKAEKGPCEMVKP